MHLTLRVLVVFTVMGFSSMVSAATVEERIAAIEARRDAKINLLEARYGGNQTKLDALVARTEAATAVLVARLEALASPN